jgi:hypothetical protein
MLKKLLKVLKTLLRRAETGNGKHGLNQIYTCAAVFTISSTFSRRNAIEWTKPISRRYDDGTHQKTAAGRDPARIESDH